MMSVKPRVSGKVASTMTSSDIGNMLKFTNQVANYLVTLFEDNV